MIEQDHLMEFLQGSDLAAWLQQRGALGIEQTADLLLQACEAIAEAHALGIVHRDLKPANLFVVRGADGLYSVKVLDFGISKVSGSGASTTDMGLTKTTAVMGSPMYMSPEQMEASRNVDARTDIWALGVILFELVTGKVPFDGETVPEVCVRIVSHSPPPLWNLRPDAPAGLEAIMLRCLEKDRTKRYANVAELAVALSEFGSKRGKASAERVLRVVQSAGLGGADSMPPSSSSPRPPGTIGGWGQNAARSLGAHKAALGGVAALGAFFGMAIVLAMMKSSGQASPVTVTAAESSPAPSRATSPVDVRSVPIGPAAATLETEPGAKPMFRVDAGLPVAPRTLSTVAPSGVGAAAHATPLGATATPPSKPNPNCDPPFTVDIAGIKHAKPECL
jgi:serine/threonine-protein kinase